MTSYVAKVIASKSEAEAIDMNNRTMDIKKKVEALDKEVKDYIEKNYVSFSSFLKDDGLSYRAISTAEEIKKIEEKIDKLIKEEGDSTTSEISKTLSKLRNIDNCLCIVNRMIEVDNLIRNAENDQYRNCYLEAAKKFNLLKELLSSDSHLKNLMFFESLVNYVNSIQEKFLEDSLKIWKEFISWNFREIANGEKITTLNIDINDGKPEIIKVLFYYNHLDYLVEILSKKMFNLLFEPIIKYGAGLKIKTNDSTWTIEVEYQEKPSLVDCKQCEQVVNNLNDVFMALFDSLDSFIHDDDTFMGKIGERIENDLYSCFLEYSVYRAIPTKKDELVNFDETACKIIEFDSFMKDNGFIKQTNRMITDCLNNLNNLFMSKTSQTYLSQARQIFDNGLHDIVEVKPAPNNKSKFINDENICPNVSEKATCFISKSTLELITLISDCFLEISKAEINHAVELYYTVRNIITLYHDLMPLKHDNFIKSIPQQSAIFFNNCMYLAHELLNLDMESMKYLPDTMHVTLIDLIEPLKYIGNAALDTQINIQQKEIILMIESSDLLPSLSNGGDPDKPTESIEKSLKCLTLFKQLQNVWQHILPHSIYNKSMGRICNTFVTALIEYALQQEDITLDMVGQLTNLFTIMLEDIPSLFTVPKEVHRHIKCWSRFNELLLVINGTLKDINDRWADGKGPLAQEFSADQIRHLIRALFQQTDRRSALLGKIR